MTERRGTEPRYPSEQRL